MKSERYFKRIEQAFKAGVMNHKEGCNLGDCPYNKKAFIKAWRDGWEWKESIKVAIERGEYYVPQR